MIKTLTKLKRAEREGYTRPKSVEQAIPITRIWDDGVMLVGKNKYAKTYQIADINYAVASKDDKEALFLEYCELLNSFDSGATTKITVATRKLDMANFEENILIPYQDDDLDVYRHEYNDMLMHKARYTNSMIREVFITVSIVRKSINEARSYFNRTTSEITGHLMRLGSKCTELTDSGKLRLLHDFFCAGGEGDFFYDARDSARKGHSFKDSIVAESLEIESSYFKMGERVGRVLYLKDFASYIKDSFLTELTDQDKSLVLSIDIVPVPTDEAVREVENRLLGVETNITNWTRKQNQNLNYNVAYPMTWSSNEKRAASS